MGNRKDEIEVELELELDTTLNALSTVLRVLDILSEIEGPNSEILSEIKGATNDDKLIAAARKIVAEGPQLREMIRSIRAAVGEDK